MTLSWPSFFAAVTRPSSPPKSAAEVASPALTPEEVSAPELSFAGGAQAAIVVTTMTEEVSAATRSRRLDVFMARTFRWTGDATVTQGLPPAEIKPTYRGEPNCSVAPTNTKSPNACWGISCDRKDQSRCDCRSGFICCSCWPQ